MPTSSQQATGFADDWFRGVTYTRELTLVDATGAVVNLSTWTGLVMAVEIITAEGRVLRPASTEYGTRYDENRSGASGGAINVAISAAAMELGWESGSDFNVVRWSVKGTSGASLERPIFNCDLTVTDTAFA